MTKRNQRKKMTKWAVVPRKTMMILPHVSYFRSKWSTSGLWFEFGFWISLELPKFRQLIFTTWECFNEKFLFFQRPRKWQKHKWPKQRNLLLESVQFNKKFNWILKTWFNLSSYWLEIFSFLHYFDVF